MPPDVPRDDPQHALGPQYRANKPSLMRLLQKASRLFTLPQMPKRSTNVALFNNNRHFEVHGSPQFLNAYNLNVANTYGGNYDFLDVMKPSVSFGALHDSYVDDPEHRCRPETRQYVLKKVQGWIDDTTAAERIFWLHGSAGSGKSAIAHTIVDSNGQGKMAATFFFCRSDTDRNNGNRLFMTLAWQLALSIPSIQSHIVQSLNRNPGLPWRSVETQFQELIAQPFQAIVHNAASKTQLPSLVVIIDGIDECPDENLQRRILTVIGNAASNPDVPLRFLISSRLEAHIKGAFDQFKCPVLCIDLRYEKLEELVSFDAIHNSRGRGQSLAHAWTSSSHGHTLQQLQGWVDSWSSEPISWLHGPAGSGKSAIAQSIADLNEREKVAATFFLHRSKVTCTDGTRLFPTLCWQLASSIPTYKDYIIQYLAQCSFLPRQDVEEQFEELIVRPFGAVAAVRSQEQPLDWVVIIDGVDECGDLNIQQKCLQAIENNVRYRRIPLRFLITSRSGSHVQQTTQWFRCRTGVLSIDLGISPLGAGTSAKPYHNLRIAPAKDCEGYRFPSPYFGLLSEPATTLTIPATYDSGSAPRRMLQRLPSRSTSFRGARDVVVALPAFNAQDKSEKGDATGHPNFQAPSLLPSSRLMLPLAALDTPPKERPQKPKASGPSLRYEISTPLKLGPIRGKADISDVASRNTPSRHRFTRPDPVVPTSPPIPYLPSKSTFSGRLRDKVHVGHLEHDLSSGPPATLTPVSQNQPIRSSSRAAASSSNISLVDPPSPKPQTTTRGLSPVRARSPTIRTRFVFPSGLSPTPGCSSPTLRKPFLESSRTSLDPPNRTSYDDISTPTVSPASSRGDSPAPASRRVVSPMQQSYDAQNRICGAAEHRELIRNATSMLCREMARPPPHLTKTENGMRDWEEVERRISRLKRLERVWTNSGAIGLESQSGTVLSAAGEDRERNLFADALKDGYVLCHLINKLCSSSVVRPDAREDGLFRSSNATKFLTACTSYGLPSEDLFQPDDLNGVTSKTLARVAKTVIALINYVPLPSNFLSGQGKKQTAVPVPVPCRGSMSRASASTRNLSPVSSSPSSSPTRKHWSPPYTSPLMKSSSEEGSSENLPRMLVKNEDMARWRSADGGSKSRDRKLSETPSVAIVTEEANVNPAWKRDQNEIQNGGAEQKPQKPEKQEKIFLVHRHKGRWPDDFIDLFDQAKPSTIDVQTPPLESNEEFLYSVPPQQASPHTEVSRIEKVEVTETDRMRRSQSTRYAVDNALSMPSRLRRKMSPDGATPAKAMLRRRSTKPSQQNVIYHDPRASVLVPRAAFRGRVGGGPTPVAETSPNHEQHKVLRGRFQGDVENIDVLFGRRSRTESMITFNSASASDLRESIDGSRVKKTIVVKEAGKPSVQYKLSNCIGRGQFGSVYRALNLSTGQTVAVKQIRLESLKESEVTELMRKVNIYKRLSHPGIVRYEGLTRDDETLNIVLECAENGSLGQTLKSYGKLNERLVASYTAKILEGLYYLHGQDVVHCDLKAANILVTKAGNVKLTDFGVSLNLRAMEGKIKDVAGTPNWMAPEIIELKGASAKSDIWSLACTIIELLTGSPPYMEISNTMTVMFRIVEDRMPPIPEECSDLAREFLLQCFNKDPAQRPSAEILSEHPWLKQNKGIYRELRPQDSIPFLRRVSADLQKAGAVPHIDSSPLEQRFSTSSMLEIDFSPREHTFVKTTFSKAIHCQVCSTDVKKGAVICSLCSLVSHLKCASNAPPMCDLRAQSTRASYRSRTSVDRKSPLGQCFSTYSALPLGETDFSTSKHTVDTFSKELVVPKMDELYFQILKWQPDPVFLKDILALIIVRTSILKGYDDLWKDDAVLLNISNQELQTKLRRMRSLLHLVPYIKAHDQSFLDFLQDASRSGQYHISKEEGSRRYLKLITGSLIRYVNKVLNQPKYHETHHFTPRFSQVVKEYPRRIELPVAEWQEVLQPLLNLGRKMFISCAKCTAVRIIRDLLLHFEFLRRISSIRSREPTVDEVEEFEEHIDDTIVTDDSLHNCLSLLLAHLRGPKSQPSATDTGITTQMCTVLYFDCAEIAARIHSVSGAQNLVDVIVDMLDEDFFLNQGGPDVNRKAILLVLEIYARIPVLPRSLFLEGSAHFDIEKWDCRSSEIEILCQSALIGKILDKEYIVPVSRICEEEGKLTFVGCNGYERRRSLRQWRTKACPSFGTVTQVMLEVAKAFRYLHSMGVILHYETDSDDIFLDSKLSPTIRFMGSFLLYIVKTPSICLKQDSKLLMTREANVFNFGCLFYQTIFNVKILLEDRVKFKRDFVIKSSKHPDIPNHVWKLIHLCCGEDPKRRPTMNEVVEEMETWSLPPLWTLPCPQGAQLENNRKNTVGDDA